jgi:hypothetical protein
MAMASNRVAEALAVLRSHVDDIAHDDLSSGMARKQDRGIVARHAYMAAIDTLVIALRELDTTPPAGAGEVVAFRFYAEWPKSQQAVLGHGRWNYVTAGEYVPERAEPLYAAPTPLPEAVQELVAADLAFDHASMGKIAADNRITRGDRGDDDFVKQASAHHSYDRAFARRAAALAALRAIPAQAQRKENDDGK